MVVLEKNENSYVLDISKHCTQEFFNNVFDPSGPFWNLYENLDFAIKPASANYANFIYGRLFFCKNIENKFIKTFGMEKYYEVNNEFLYERTEKSIANLFLAFSAPFDMARQATSKIRFGFLASEIVKNYENFH